nr:PadR family transcriptional regulator [uncultured Tessaracoccus sp.]
MHALIAVDIQRGHCFTSQRTLPNALFIRSHLRALDTPIHGLRPRQPDNEAHERKSDQRPALDRALATTRGAVYPMLSRLRSSGLVETTWHESPSGPPRRCYRLTAEGEQAHVRRAEAWRELVADMASLTGIKGDPLEFAARLDAEFGVDELMSSIRRSSRACSGFCGICRSSLFGGVCTSAIPTLIKGADDGSHRRSEVGLFGAGLQSGARPQAVNQRPGRSGQSRLRPGGLHPPTSPRHHTVVANLDQHRRHRDPRRPRRMAVHTPRTPENRQPSRATKHSE